MRYGTLIGSDITFINSQAAWTDDQKRVFNLLITDRYTDVGIMVELHMSSTRYYRIKKDIKEKIDGILRENQEKINRIRRKK